MGRWKMKMSIELVMGAGDHGEMAYCYRVVGYDPRARDIHLLGLLAWGWEWDDKMGGPQPGGG